LSHKDGKKSIKPHRKKEDYLKGKKKGGKKSSGWGGTIQEKSGIREPVSADKAGTLTEAEEKLNGKHGGVATGRYQEGRLAYMKKGEKNPSTIFKTNLVILLILRRATRELRAADTGARTRRGRCR